VPPSAARDDLDPVLDSILDRALQKRPADRFADGAEMAVALRACAETVCG
jgi:hypothetical protein